MQQQGVRPTSMSSADWGGLARDAVPRRAPSIGRRVLGLTPHFADARHDPPGRAAAVAIAPDPGNERAELRRRQESRAARLIVHVEAHFAARRPAGRLGLPAPARPLDQYGPREGYSRHNVATSADPRHERPELRSPGLRDCVDRSVRHLARRATRLRPHRCPRPSSRPPLPHVPGRRVRWNVGLERWPGGSVCAASHRLRTP